MQELLCVSKPTLVTTSVSDMCMHVGVCTNDLYSVPPPPLPPSVSLPLPPLSMYSTLLYELILIGKPFRNATRECVIWRVGNGCLQPLTLLPRDRLRGIIQRCWQLSPDSRPTFKDILTDVEQNVSAPNTRDFSGKKFTCPNTQCHTSRNRGAGGMPPQYFKRGALAHPIVTQLLWVKHI